MAKKQNKTGGEPIKINVKGSSLAEFTKRNLPTEKEVEDFEEIFDDEPEEAIDEEMDEEIEESLNEIYQDENGHQVDVRKFDVLKRHGFFFWLFVILLILGGIALATYAGYQYFYLGSGTDPTAIDFFIEGETDVVAGEEFFYTINYSNTSNTQFRDAEIEVNFPEDFIILDSFPAPDADKENVWHFNTIPPKHNGKIKIKGKIVGEEDKTGLVIANIRYMPANFSSEFKKDANFTTKIFDTGLDIDFDYLKSVLVGDENEVVLRLKSKEKSYINNFRLSLEPRENIEVLGIGETGGEEEMITYKDIRPGVWEIEEITGDEKILPIRYRFTEKASDEENLLFNFDIFENNQDYHIQSEELPIELMKSDLNLTLIINGSREDQGVDFGQTLNYSIVYNNKGEAEMKDVVVQAVLTSDWLDWASLNDPLSGSEKGNTITWSKEQLPELEVLDQNEEGTIDFSIKIMDIDEVKPGQDYKVESYTLFSVGGAAEEDKPINEDNSSNIIVNKINSDLKLNESLRYFSVDNIPVGTGPHPPKVGETTSYKVYWDITNNLHEIDSVGVSVILPEYVGWDDKVQVSVGSIQYIEETHTVVWNVGRLPLTVFQANAEFSIKITPGEDDKNKILVLLPGSEIQAVDSETDAKLTASTKARTTKLEDDDIAVGDGIIE